MKPLPLNVTCLDHINMRVKNLVESIAFYERVFGFELVEVQDDGRT